MSKETVKHLLVVTNPFPPKASGGNARTLRLLKYLPEHGWRATVLTVRASGPVPAPDGVEIVRPPTPSPEGLYRLARRLFPRGATAGGTSGQAPESAATPPRYSSRRKAYDKWIFVPDQFVGWVPPALFAGRDLARAGRADAVLAIGPMFTNHVVGACLARLTGAPLVSEYRDPWTTAAGREYPSSAHRRANAWLEDRCLREARRVVTISQPIVDDLVGRHPFLAGRAGVIPHSFDRGEPVERVDLEDGFWLVHTGRFYRREAQAVAVLRALTTLPDDVKLLFAGVEGSEMMAEARRQKVEDRVRVLPFVPHPQSLGLQHAADGLLLITTLGPESVSSKTFEYLAAGKPIFAVTPPTTAAHRLLHEVGGVMTVSPDAAVDEPLAAFVAAVRSGRLRGPSAEATLPYEAPVMARRYAELFDSVARRIGVPSEARHESTEAP
jgi:glycosyltransferase involved in cell wall biosynthesis